MSVVKLPVGDRFAYSSLQFTVNLLGRLLLSMKSLSAMFSHSFYVSLCSYLYIYNTLEVCILF